MKIVQMTLDQLIAEDAHLPPPTERGTFCAVAASAVRDSDGGVLIQELRVRASAAPKPFALC